MHKNKSDYISEFDGIRIVDLYYIIDIGFDDGKIHQVDDKITYIITQGVGESLVTMFSTYKSMILEDKILDGLKFELAIIYVKEKNGETVELESNSEYGTLKYDDKNKTISFIFDN